MPQEPGEPADNGRMPQDAPSASIFIDESYSNRDYYVAAMLATDAQAADIEQRFQVIRQDARFKWGMPDDIEFHAYDIMQGKGQWHAFYGRVGDAAALYRRLLKAIVDSEAQVAVQGVDVGRLNLRFQYPATPYEVVVRRALEQVNLWCEGASPGQARVFADSVRPDLNPATAAFRRAIDGSTLAASSTHPGPLTAIGPVTLVESKDYSGVQAADLAAHIVRRHLEQTNASATARRLARSLYNTLEPALRYSAKWRP